MLLFFFKLDPTPIAFIFLVQLKNKYVMVNADTT
jgi:hypothetical protein